VLARCLNSGYALRASESPRTAAVCLLQAIALVLYPLALHAQGQVNPEYRTKASYISKFPRFVDWPADTINSPRTSFLICVIGDYPFGISLSQLVLGKTFRNHRYEVRWVHNPTESRSCQILFVSKSEQKRYRLLLDMVSGQTVLTVGETPEFLDAGGMIAFSMPADTLQFDVNLAAASKAHLKMSSQLLTLARRVVPATVAEAAKS
jgi:uncharacterized protein DUF4154